MKMLLALVLFASCASQSSEWVEVPIAPQLQEWRWCDMHKDGPAYADKGWCWIGKECKRRFLRSDECRTKPNFCAFGDVPCMKAQQLDRKTLVNQ